MCNVCDAYDRHLCWRMQELFQALERGEALPVRVQGPIGLPHAELPWLRYPYLVCVTGGIGVRPSPYSLSSPCPHPACNMFCTNSTQSSLLSKTVLNIHGSLGQRETICLLRY